ncbi:methyltransferase domain-containing protein [bacterium]|nr:methyltransferase domain-containing protein [bacterium]
MIKLLARYILPVSIYKLLSRIKYKLVLIFGYRDIKIFTPNYEQAWDDKIKKQIPKRRIKKLKLISLLIEKNSSVLDFGCGDGVGLEFIKKKGITSKLYGIDISKKAIEECEKKGISAKQGNICDRELIKSLKKFDYLILADVIEHIPNPEEILIALKDKFNKGIIISLPNTGFIRDRIRFMLGKFPMQWDVFPGKHLRFWTYNDFLWWLGQLGFRVKRFIPGSGILLMRKIWPNLFCDVMVVLLAKRKN